MGAVWIAEHLVLGTHVAVKVIARPWASVPSARARFLREARLTAKVDSPHVVRVLDCRFDESDEPYLVLELLQGEDLQHRVRCEGPLPVSEVVEIIAQACEGMYASHEAGIVHRDVKPENVFLVAGPRPLVKLLDFGIARPSRADDLVESDKLAAGTPQYMSPEQMFEPEATTPRSDLFSLAAVAYFALTRRPPFAADTIEGLYLAMDRGRFDKPSAIRPELSPALDAWFERALANRPEDRFPDARAMASALYDAVRVPSLERPTLDDVADEELPPCSRRTLTELAPLPLVNRSRARVAVVALAAAAAAIFVWHASMGSVAVAQESVDASVGAVARTPEPSPTADSVP
jgi:serine/threonine-protein kinase